MKHTEQLEFFEDDHSDLGNGERECSKCRNLLPLSFYSKSNGGNFLRAECKSCNNKLSKVRKVLYQNTVKLLKNTLVRYVLVQKKTLKVEAILRTALGF